MRFNLHSEAHRLHTNGSHARETSFREERPLENIHGPKIRNCCVVIAGSALPLPTKVMRNKFERDKCKQHTAPGAVRNLVWGCFFLGQTFLTVWLVREVELQYRLWSVIYDLFSFALVLGGGGQHHAPHLH